MVPVPINGRINCAIFRPAFSVIIASDKPTSRSAVSSIRRVIMESTDGTWTPADVLNFAFTAPPAEPFSTD